MADVMANEGVIIGNKHEGRELIDLMIMRSRSMRIHSGNAESVPCTRFWQACQFEFGGTRRMADLNG